MTLKQTINQVNTWHSSSQKVVLVTGVFDLLHIEHLRFLKQAKTAGDKLIVGIETDARVKTIKGHERPVNGQAIRQEQLQALKAVDLVFILPESFSAQADWESLMSALKPDIYAVSSHTSYLKNKQAICDQLGIQLQIVHQFNPDYSTSKLYQLLRQSL